jgi:kynurenine formamidase
MKKVLILSHPINEDTVLYAGERSVKIKKTKSIKGGDSYNKSFCSFSAHTGTHLDAPRHFLNKGKTISDLLAKELVYGKVRIFDIKNVKPGNIINENSLNKLRDCELLFIRTGFEKKRNNDVYWKNSPCLDASLALWFKRNCPSIRALGVDFISISNLKSRELGRQAHKAFLGNGILLIEDMKLKDLKGAPDSVIVAPLLLEGAEAAPCTVFAFYN